MAKKKEEIEEAVVVEETISVNTPVLSSDLKKPTLPTILDKQDCLDKISIAYAKYADIEIKGTNDKDNYKLVVAGIKELRDSRLAWDKSVDQNMLAPAKEWYESVKNDISTIINDFKSKEEALKAKKTKIDNDKQKEKDAIEAKKVKAMAERIETIVNLGGKSDGVRYLFDYDITLFVSIASLKDLDDKKWKNALQEIQDAYDYEQKRLADQKLLETQLAEQNTAKEKELAEKQRKLRVKELTLAGFNILEPDGDKYEDSNGNSVCTIMIDNSAEEEWDEMLLSFQYSADEYKDILGLDVPDISTIDGIIDFISAPAIPAQKEHPLPFPSATPKSVIPAIDYQADNNEDLPFFDEPKLETTSDFSDLEAEEQISNIVTDNGLTTVVLQFDALDPFIEFPMGVGFIQRIYHPDFEDYAHEMASNQEIVTQGDIEVTFEKLKFVLIAVS